MPPVASRSSTRSTRSPGRIASWWISTASVPYSREYSTRLVRHGGHVVLVVQVEPGTNREEIARQLHAQLGWARLDRILFVDVLPVDARHNAKVDYPALERLLARVGGRT